MDAVRNEWKARLTDGERQMLAWVYGRKTPYARRGDGEAQAVDDAIAHCFVRAAVVPERKLVTEALKRGICAVTIEKVRRELGKRPLIWSDIAGRKMATLKHG